MRRELVEADYGSLKAKSDKVKMELVASSEQLKRLEVYSVEDHNRFEADRFERQLVSQNEKVARLQSELLQVREEADSLKTERTGLTETISWEIVEKGEVESKIKDLQTQIARLFDETDVLSNLYEGGRTKMIANGFTVEKDATDTAAYRSKMQEYKDTLDEEEASLRKALTEGSERLKQTLQKKLDELEENQKVLTDMILRKKKVLQEMRGEISEGGSKLRQTLDGLVQE